MLKLVQTWVFQVKNVGFKAKFVNFLWLDPIVKILVFKVTILVF